MCFIALCLWQPAVAQDASTLRLVPFPKKVEMGAGRFELDRALMFEVPAPRARVLGGLVNAELRRAGLPAARVEGSQSESLVARLVPAGVKASQPLPFRDGHGAEDYHLRIEPDAVLCEATAEIGLSHAVQTLCQMIRANRRGTTLPCLAIEDWPSMRWRCFQDDMTRGPSSRLSTLKQEIDMGANLKMNLFTYYMESQFAFEKHPTIGPKNGSLEKADLSSLVEYAKQRSMEIMGNQQSFAHLTEILKIEKYSHLAESSSIICPVHEETYRFLDDLYSEVCPLVPFEFFNVCCDETAALGTGPSKTLAEKIGVDGVYVRHILRLHELLTKKHNKRMMMWGDIIRKHPDKLDDLPKDIIMLTWAYDGRKSFDRQIRPFAKSKFEFFVCPGINNWRLLIPDFAETTANIHNFVRDGARHGALGMLNTAWEDFGEALQGYKWHGYAWGAECSWNASTTPANDFNRRVGAVLFGEKGNHFGEAIKLLSRTHRIRGMNGMKSERFWQNDFKTFRKPKRAAASAKQVLEFTRPALAHLEACKRDATANAELLDVFILATRRMDLLGQRMLDALEAGRLYGEARKLGGKDALAKLDPIKSLVVADRDAHRALGAEFERIWLLECKPYALDWTMKRFDDKVKSYDDLLARLATIRQKAENGETLPERLFEK